FRRFVSTDKAGAIRRHKKRWAVACPPHIHQTAFLLEVLRVADVRHAAERVVQLRVVVRMAEDGIQRRILVRDITRTNGELAVPRRGVGHLQVDRVPRLDLARDASNGVRVTVSRIFPVTGHAGGGGRQVVERQVRGDRTDQPSGGQDTAIIRSTSQIQQVFYASTLEQLLVVGQDAAVLRTEEDRAGSTDFEAVLDVDVDTISLEALAVDGRRVDFTQQTTFTDDASTGRQRTTFELRVKQCLGGLHDDVVQDDVVVVNANAEVGSRRPHRTEGP